MIPEHVSEMIGGLEVNRDIVTRKLASVIASESDNDLQITERRLTQLNDVLLDFMNDLLTCRKEIWKLQKMEKEATV